MRHPQNHPQAVQSCKQLCHETKNRVFHQQNIYGHQKGLLILPLISLDSPQQQWPKVKQFDNGRREYTLLSRDRATRKSSTIKQPLRTMRIFQVTVFGNILLLPFLHYWVVWRCFAPKTACCLLRHWVQRMLFMTVKKMQSFSFPVTLETSGLLIAGQI